MWRGIIKIPMDEINQTPIKFEMNLSNGDRLRIFYRYFIPFNRSILDLKSVRVVLFVVNFTKILVD